MSIQSSLLGKIEYLPLDQIRRPIPPVLDYQKIDAMVSTLKGNPMASYTCSLEDAQAMNGELPPIDVMRVKENGKVYYFAFGGCHRFQAYERLNGEKLVKCKILPATKKQLSLYLGASVDTMFN
ncbi:sulfiredoxin [Ascoidea rubescens DSM 1968]|uniref:Sulfiredoxin n=1 Tax=Ascoidea rubescens DSM 1968 TaxID=1344418 RepID=A0A1D2VBY8_9ASCO|nr:sulfiredoxin [Ascoidea rubescens DSM 1968]ODV59131.1 sulfiredoxin [Ascoidea rubescens DSM 1968]